MDIFDSTIGEIKLWSQQRQEEALVRHYDVILPAERKFSSKNLALPKNVSIILKEDTHLELGHPSVGSCSATLATHDTSLIKNGRISLIGPEIYELEEGKVPFAQIAMACCRGDVKEFSQLMDRHLHRSAQDEGYMIRSVPNIIWARVSKEAVRARFSFDRLGQRLIESLWHEFEEITAIEVLFVTTCREDILTLNHMIDTARAKLKKILSFELKGNETYECTTGNDCAECPEQEVCDSIRDVIKLRKGDRIISFGGEEQ
jgi:CO dehydrogenase/acetyl-CoA synthase beta subunit